MARQTGLLKFEGTVGDIIFYKRGNEYFVRSKNKFNPEKRSERSKENSSEFSQASAGSKLIRKAFSPFIEDHKDGTRHNNLIRILNGIVKTDALNPRGKRNIQSGDISLIRNFQLNSASRLGDVLKSRCECRLERSNLQVDIPEFRVGGDLKIPEGTTHVRFEAAAAAFDFNRREYMVSPIQSLILDVTEGHFGGGQLHLEDVSSVHPVLLVCLSVRFLRSLNGKEYPLNNPSCQPAEIIGAWSATAHPDAINEGKSTTHSEEDGQLDKSIEVMSSEASSSGSHTDLGSENSSEPASRTRKRSRESRKEHSDEEETPKAVQLSLLLP